MNMNPETVSQVLETNRMAEALRRAGELAELTRLYQDQPYAQASALVHQALLDQEIPPDVARYVMEQTRETNTKTARNIAAHYQGPPGRERENFINNAMAYLLAPLTATQPRAVTKNATVTLLRPHNTVPARISVTHTGGGLPETPPWHELLESLTQCHGLQTVLLDEETDIYYWKETARPENQGTPRRATFHLSTVENTDGGGSEFLLGGTATAVDSAWEKKQQKLDLPTDDINRIVTARINVRIPNTYDVRTALENAGILPAAQI